MLNFIKGIVTTYKGSIDWVGLIIFVIIAFIILLVIFWVVLFIINQIGYRLVDEQKEKATITNKYYAPESSSTDVGMGYNASGAGPVVTATFKDETFTIEVEFTNKERIRTEVTKDCFDHCDVGNSVTVGYKLSKWTKMFKVIALYM